MASFQASFLLSTAADRAFRAAIGLSRTSCMLQSQREAKKGPGSEKRRRWATARSLLSLEIKKRKSKESRHHHRPPREGRERLLALSGAPRAPETDLVSAHGGLVCVRSLCKGNTRGRAGIKVEKVKRVREESESEFFFFLLRPRPRPRPRHSRALHPSFLSAKGPRAVSPARSPPFPHGMYVRSSLASFVVVAVVN